VGEVGGMGFFHTTLPGGEIPQTPFFFDFLCDCTKRIVTMLEDHRKGMGEPFLTTTYQN
jgi:hypothetical protein